MQTMIATVMLTKTQMSG